MDRTETSSRTFWLTILTFTALANLVMVRSTYLRLMGIGANLRHSSWSIMLFLCLGIVVVCIWMFVRVARFGAFRIPVQGFGYIKFEALPWRIFGGILFLSILVLIPYTKFAYQIGQSVKTPVYDPGLLLLFYYWMCWWAILLSMTALKLTFKTTWQGGFVSALILLGIVYEVLVRFNAVTTYPFSMGWSEGSRYYYASLYFSKWIYGESLPLSTLHPTRYLLQSAPFLIPSLDIGAHRLWQFLLWIVLTGITAIVLARRVFFPQERVMGWLFAGWFFLFLLRVGVYYHLEVMVFVPLLFVSMKHPWRTLLAVIAASIWAGVSRVNWFPVPAMIAIAIYLMETPVGTTKPRTSSFKHLMGYLSQPALWAVTGLVFALASQAAYIPLSGNADNAKAFASSFTSDMLWYRLWPNASNSLGVIPSLLIVTGPLILALILAARQWKALHPIRWIGLFSMVLVLFAGSLVVSVKIGGGGDLHNADTYAVLIGIVTAYFIGGQVKAENEPVDWDVRRWSLILTAIVIHIVALIPALSPYPKFHERANQRAYQQLVDIVNEAGTDGPILMIAGRELATFGSVDVRAVPEYEVVTLMEMAMSRNQDYLDQFYSDLENHRFAAIVAGRQSLGIQKEGSFSEENNVWNTYISPYILCYYQPEIQIEADRSTIQVFIPRDDTDTCP